MDIPSHVFACVPVERIFKLSMHRTGTGFICALPIYGISSCKDDFDDDLVGFGFGNRCVFNCHMEV